MLEEISRLDRDLLIYLNSLHHPILDVVMTAVSGKWFWTPLYGLLVAWLVVQFKKRSWLLLPIIALAVALADRISSGLFKPYFERFRPCHDGRLCDLLHLPDGCGGYYGFVSSHAANSFVVAMLLHLLLRPAYIKYRALLWIWAALVSYSRVYLAAHYPADIIFGGIMGILVGWFVYLLYRFLERKIYGDALVLQEPQI